MSRFKVRSRGVILHEGKLLVVRHRPEANYFALPGGHLDLGESPKECMQRELVEELGISPIVGRLLYIATFTDRSGAQPIEFLFEIINGADYLFHAEKHKTHGHEITEARWILPEDEVVLLPQKLHDEFRNGRLFEKETRFLKE